MREQSSVPADEWAELEKQALTSKQFDELMPQLRKLHAENEANTKRTWEEERNNLDTASSTIEYLQAELTGLKADYADSDATIVKLRDKLSMLTARVAEQTALTEEARSPDVANIERLLENIHWRMKDYPWVSDVDALAAAVRQLAERASERNIVAAKDAEIAELKAQLTNARGNS